ncbi:MAG: phytanoyl-CoA dioxygenase family protein, partial [Pseudomonadota bacterium]
MSDLVRAKRDIAASEICDILARDGALIIEQALDPETLAKLTNEILPFVAATDPGRDAFTGYKTTRTGALVARSEACRNVVMTPSILDAAKVFLAPYCETIQLHLTQLIRIKPGQPVQPLHRDRLAWGGYLRADLEPQFNTIWAVTDFREDNGATQVVPGSNRWDPG